MTVLDLGIIKLSKHLQKCSNFLPVTIWTTFSPLSVSITSIYAPHIKLLIIRWIYLKDPLNPPSQMSSKILTSMNMMTYLPSFSVLSEAKSEEIPRSDFGQ
jgi:hypothetical protein